MKKMLAIAYLTLSVASGAAADDFAGKTIKLGIDPTFPPMEFKTPDGKFAGFGVDIAEALCAEIRAKCVWVESNWDGMIPSLKARKFDAIASSMSITPKRQEQIAFSDPISNSPSRLLARKGSPLQLTPESLVGKRVGVEQGSTQETYAKEKLLPAGVDVVSYQNPDLVNADLVGGRLDAAFVSQLSASEGFLKQPSGKDFAFVGKSISDQEYFGVGDGIGLRKDDVALRDAFNKALATIVADGTFSKINDKYFDFDIRSK
ncbi:ABC transporter substrate-binding protein [Ensifer adhaerens]|uniref:ABC transporter substrate-binding protein n=1 Tax=Ensifer adhaerens TaxID=106592 RepID=UPI000CF16815|nr:ABC transporter substrate-binding protein [Ensifer adhaerens]